jgi:putative addiction module component (TIGR02574 family)
MRLVTMTTFADIFNAAQGLPAIERLRLIDALCGSVSPNEWPSPSDEWIAEAQRRSAEYDAGTMSASPWSEVRQRARKKAGLDG